jgi:hypothetical protein
MITESPHAAQAVNRLRNGTHTEVARAAVEATLAVAYEQRTANLIALAMIHTQLGKVPPGTADAINERMGLRA